MHEVAAPSGYTVATDVTFTVENGKVKTVSDPTVLSATGNVITMVDDGITTVELSKKNVSGDEITGAKLTLTGTDAAGNVVTFTADNFDAASKITVSTDGKTLSWTSDASGAKTVTNLPDGTYTMHEDVAPKGYKIATDITFTVAAGKVKKVGNVEVSSTAGNVITMVDDGITTVELSKQDIAGNEISGAEMTLAGTDTAGNAVVFTTANFDSTSGITISGDGKTLSWTSSENGTKKVKDLPNGTYVMHEVAAPSGYKVATDITFKVSEGKVTEVNSKAYSDESNVVAMIDEGYTTVKLSKQDIAGEEISGAEITLTGTDAAGNTVTFTTDNFDAESGITIIEAGKKLLWVSDANGAKTIKNLPDGTYRMSEVAAPSGYKVATDITFTVKAGKVTKVGDVAVSSDAGNVITMVDDGITTVKLSKTDVSGNEISGAKLTLTGKDTKNVAVTFTSTQIGADTSIAISTDGKTLSWTSDKNGAKSIINLPNGTYVMHEVTAPDGYVVATDITFEVANGKVTNVTGTTATSTDSNVIVMVDAAQSGGTPGGNTPGGNTPGGDTPGGNTPGGDTPGGNTPGGNTPGGDTPGGNTPGGNTPGGNTPGGNTPGGNTPGGDTPGGDTPGGNTPGGNTPGGDTPGGNTPGGDTPGGNTPGGDTPGGNTPGGNTPGRRYPRWKYPRWRYPRRKYPRWRYPRWKYPRWKYPRWKYPRWKYPRWKYPRWKYPRWRYPRWKYSRWKYPRWRYPRWKYPRWKYPRRKYSRWRYPRWKYPRWKYPRWKYPRRKYSRWRYTPGGDTPGGNTPGGDTPGGNTPDGDTPGGTTGTPEQVVTTTQEGNTEDVTTVGTTETTEETTEATQTTATTATTAADNTTKATKSTDEGETTATTATTKATTEDKGGKTERTTETTATNGGTTARTTGNTDGQTVARTTVSTIYVDRPGVTTRQTVAGDDEKRTVVTHTKVVKVRTDNGTTSPDWYLEFDDPNNPFGYAYIDEDGNTVLVFYDDGGMVNGSDKLPKTGTSPIGYFVAFGMMTLMLGVTIAAKKREEEE